MENSVIEEIRALEATFEIKLRQLKGSNDEESKELICLQNTVEQLEDSLHKQIKRVINAVIEKINSLPDPFTQLTKETE